MLPQLQKVLISHEHPEGDLRFGCLFGLGEVVYFFELVIILDHDWLGVAIFHPLQSEVPHFELFDAVGPGVELEAREFFEEFPDLVGEALGVLGGVDDSAGE